MVKKPIERIFNSIILWCFGWRKRYLMQLDKNVLTYRDPKTGMYYSLKGAIAILEDRVKGTKPLF